MTVAYYRVISRGTGRRPESVVVTEALLARPWVEWAIPLEFPPLTPLDRFCQQFAQLHVCGTLAWRQIR